MLQKSEDCLSDGVGIHGIHEQTAAGGIDGAAPEGKIGGHDGQAGGHVLVELGGLSMDDGIERMHYNQSNAGAGGQESGD